ncbi:hypothetical protein Pedsa_3693 [Pseudopedobacter saltans DSM 12145]|uniref:NACHT domain-containing protein n=1 Tax=Pseudopedobacter saltans (strain ATCC 51119 / DSM 12145 / JCM 21818 / CCUG 39354 / LMG 10337 / NBRC 100064 / NCIMB 13643) TaxID=762903 RepID=F0S5P8_PSESL|nr:hypothetical protein [Pseudopedobacter saltans]ADY54222.1 hypothetical protein Pedsa_3693 [Pseudopedobacter saltans DSM 12145]
MDRDLLLLKKQILEKSSITVPTPADCKRIAYLISQAVNKNISETTIKRLFGFAKTTHNFSKYTLTALQEFIGETRFYHLEEESEGLNIDKKIKLLKTESENLTLKTLNNIKSKSTIKYSYTTRREFCEREFNYFYKKDYFFCSYVAQAGYGKSIMLANLVENFFLKEDAVFKDDMLWFFNPHMLLDLESHEYNIDSWLNAHIKQIVPEGFISFCDQSAELLNGKVVFIIDGLDDVTLKKDSFNKLINSLADFIFSNSRHTWLKVVISMRNIGWLNFYEKIRHSAYIKSKWYSGNYSSGEEFTNMPPLTDKEIDNVISNFSIDASSINPKTKLQLRTPFYLRFFHELLGTENDETYFTDLTYYELISKYVHLKINLSAHYTEKIILLKKLIAVATKAQKGNAVEKTELLTDIVTFKDAYEELLLHGVLVEEKHYGGVLPVEIIRFQQVHVFEYFLFIETLDKHQRQVDSTYLKYIDDHYENSPLGLKLLQWTVRYVVINDQSESLTKLIRHEIPIAEKKYFLFFIAEMLESREKNRQLFYSDFNHKEVHAAFLSQLLGFDFTDFYYKNTLKSLFKTTQSVEQRFLYQSLLGYVYFFELKIDQLKAVVDELNALINHNDIFENKQIETFELMLDYLSGNTENAERIIDFVADKAVLDHVKPGSLDTKAVLSYFCYCMVAILYGRNDAFVKASEIIYAKHPAIFKRRSGLSLYLLIISAFVHLNDDLKLVERIVRHITLVKNSVGDNFHSFFYLMLCFLMILMNLSKSNIPKTIIYLEEGLSIAELKKVHYFEKLFLLISVNIYNHVGDFEKSEKNSYTLHCLVDDMKISTKNVLKFLRGIGANAPDLFSK